MAGDYSRRTFLPEKHYSGVLMQQGRVQLDADWNEQWEVAQYRISTETVDLIGCCGVPRKGGGFQIGLTAAGDDLPIGSGRIYIDGRLFEISKTEGPFSYFHQPYYPQPDGEYFTNWVPPASPPESPLSPPDSPLGSPPDSPVGSPPGLHLKDGSYLIYLDG